MKRFKVSTKKILKLKKTRINRLLAGLALKFQRKRRRNVLSNLAVTLMTGISNKSLKMKKLM